MLTSYLKSGQTVDFAIVSSRGVTSPAIEMLMTGHDMQRIGTIKLTPLEALTLADDLKRVSDYVCGVRDNVYTPSTENIQEEESLLNLHPRSAVLLANADLNPATGEHNGKNKTFDRQARGSQKAEQEDTADVESGEEDSEPHIVRGGERRDGAVVSGQRTGIEGNGETVAGKVDGRGSDGLIDWRTNATLAELVSGVPHSVPLVVDSQGHVAKDEDEPPYNPIPNHPPEARESSLVEGESANLTIGKAIEAARNPIEGEPGFAEYWLKKTGRMPDDDNANHGAATAVAVPVSAALKLSGTAGLPDGTNVDVNDDDAWADSVDWFVDAIQLDIDSIKIDREANTMWMDVVQTADGMPDARMPLTLTARPALIKSSSTRQLIEEVFAQGFRYGASWENCREDQP